MKAFIPSLLPARVDQQIRGKRCPDWLHGHGSIHAAILGPALRSKEGIGWGL